MNVLSRRRVVAGAVALAAAATFSITSCSSSDDSAAASSTTSSTGQFPRTVDHFRGSTEIPAAPQRIVALDNSFTDAVLLLEAPLVGYVDYREPGLPDYLGSSRDEFAAEAESVGKVSNASLEQIAALQPDLIISAEVRDAKNYGQLSAIAPTIFTETTGPTWKDNIRLVGTALGKEELAEQKIGAYEERAAAVGAEINDTASNPVISVVRFAGEPTARLYRTTSFSGIVLSDAGLARPQSQGPDPADPDNIMQAISPELISGAEGDAIFVSTWQDPAGKSAEAAKPFLESPLWQTLKGRKIDVDDARWMSPVSIQGAHLILDDLSDTFGVDKHSG
ncbi:ABC transporter substrate-binding protein [Rhodococcus opacus]|uniref:Iron ABC transporter substrate-binding protein n=1 Tax=Rhodococcus opacus TaxID=37919 RepID=A0A1B1K4B5_RHOOP|nr:MULTISPECIES: iron-siderophore ABC transporter substrate-binding protein [Rhodococcus]NHU41253.1 iron-siderophore ABC transporter substrate-binding protein [Rhodococcus sp. A14]ANS27435.1 iron ABC transporter substrate-binding protein [Rhodococcus opacus]MCZ4585737.1 iron-siderophore ABC transporter substrate-binding protein [Rhodococcus opacus]MDI9936957.1 iron-siderophore ABC transporter substrate-binding protein [Rhodococcus sp. IEGM 1351]MDJ0416178.1 iron-siderophore ABC transporter sub